MGNLKKRRKVIFYSGVFQQTIELKIESNPL